MKSTKSQIDDQEKRWIIISLASIPLIMTLGNSMLIPILPLIEQEIGITKLQSSYIITVYSILTIICIPIAGYLSDRFSRKQVIVPALIIAGVGGLIAGLASWKMKDPYLYILIGRILQGIGASGAAPIVLPLVGDLFRHDQEASATLGIIETSNTFGKVLSPIIGSLLAGVIWFLPFIAIPIFCAISVLLVIFLVRGQPKKQTTTSFKKYWRDAVEVFKEHKRWLIAVFFIGAILMFVLFGFLFYLSSVLEDNYQFKGVIKGCLLAIPLLSLSIASYVTGKKIKDHLKVMKWITFIGIMMMGGSVALIPITKHYIFLLIVFLICGIGIGMALPALDALITESLDKKVRGVITSIYSAMRFIGVAAGPPIIAILMEHPLIWMVSLLAVFALGAGILAYRNINPET